MDEIITLICVHCDEENEELESNCPKCKCPYFYINQVDCPPDSKKRKLEEDVVDQEDTMLD